MARTTHEIVVEALQSRLRDGREGDDRRKQELRDVLSDLQSGRVKLVTPVGDGVGFVSGPREQGELASTDERSSAQQRGEVLALADRARSELKAAIDAGDHVMAVRLTRREMAAEGVVDSSATMIFEGGQAELAALLVFSYEVVLDMAKRAEVDLSLAGRGASAPPEMLGDRSEDADGGGA